MTSPKKTKAKREKASGSKEFPLGNDHETKREKRLTPLEIRERGIKAANAAVEKFAHELGRDRAPS